MLACISTETLENSSVVQEGWNIWDTTGEGHGKNCSVKGSSHLEVTAGQSVLFHKSKNAWGLVWCDDLQKESLGSPGAHTELVREEAVYPWKARAHLNHDLSPDFCYVS